jgi:hypothetical protein
LKPREIDPKEITFEHHPTGRHIGIVISVIVVLDEDVSAMLLIVADLLLQVLNESRMPRYDVDLSSDVGRSVPDCQYFDNFLWLLGGKSSKMTRLHLMPQSSAQR